MTIEEVKGHHEDDGLGCTLEDDVIISWLIKEALRLKTENAVMERALAWVAEEANTGESGDAYVMKEEALQTLAAIRATRTN